MSVPVGLAKLERAAQLLAEVRTLPDAKHVISLAAAAETYAREAKLGREAENSAMEVRLKAERKMGEMLATSVKAKGGRPTKTGSAPAPVSRLADLGITKKQSVRAQAIAAVPKRDFDARLRRVRDESEKLSAAVVLGVSAKDLRRQQARAVGHSSESVEWYSPGEPVEAGRRVLGRYDLDPASSPEANDLIRAERIFTVDDDGLRQPWRGKVFLNWPGGWNEDDESNADLWSAKLLEEHREGRATEAICLLFNAAVDRSWFHRFWDFGICFVRGRLPFRRPGGTVGRQPVHGNAVVYLGPNLGAFAREFAPLGRIVVPHGSLSAVLPPEQPAPQPAARNRKGA